MSDLQKLVTYIILFSIVAITIYLLINVHRDITAANANANADADMDNDMEKQNEMNKSKYDVMPHDITLSDSHSFISNELESDIENDRKYPTYQKSNFDNSYQKEFGFDNGMPNEEENMDICDIKKYQNKYINFRNKIENPSSGIDTVDMVNRRMLEGNGEIVADQNSNSISSVFDNLTSNRINSDAYKSINMANNNKSWLYDGDNVITGGNFFDSITGYKEPVSDMAMAF